MESRKETYQFKTEINQLMNIIIHSLYSHPEIFLRELISNASDAIDKLRFRSQLEPDILGTDTEFKIVLKADPEAGTLEVSDNGIGMTYDDVVENIGTIAKSGTAVFAEAMKTANRNDTIAPELIGQFGVGFYSSFIVAEKVTLLSRAAESDKAVKWESSGDGSYTIEETEKATRGTAVILKLKKVEQDEQDFTAEWTLRSIVKKHSDFVAYPIVMDVKRTKPVLDAQGQPDGDKRETVIEEETLNSMKAIWARDKAEVSEDEYNEFYNHISHDWNPPLAHLHLKLEGTTEYSALLYVPAKLPFDFFMHEKKHGINLYCKRVFIMENCTELMPPLPGLYQGRRRCARSQPECEPRNSAAECPGPEHQDESGEKAAGYVRQHGEGKNTNSFTGNSAISSRAGSPQILRIARRSLPCCGTERRNPTETGYHWRSMPAG